MWAKSRVVGERNTCSGVGLTSLWSGIHHGLLWQGIAGLPKLSNKTDQGKLIHVAGSLIDVRVTSHVPCHRADGMAFVGSLNYNWWPSSHAQRYLRLTCASATELSHSARNVYESAKPVPVIETSCR